MTGLEALKIIERDCEDLEQVPYGEFALIEKYLKALGIIKEKLVDVSLIKKCDFVEDYNSAVWIAGRPKLVKEEFNLLKGILNDEQ